jgi:hypothetical protein
VVFSFCGALAEQHTSLSLPKESWDPGGFLNDTRKLFEAGCRQGIPRNAQIDQRAGTMWGNDGGS